MLVLTSLWPVGRRYLQGGEAQKRRITRVHVATLSAAAAPTEGYRLVAQDDSKRPTIAANMVWVTRDFIAQFYALFAPRARPASDQMASAQYRIILSGRRCRFEKKKIPRSRQ